jgi:succinate dehydrogenase subunit C
MNVRLYVWQRATAAMMAPLVLIHIAVIFYATRQGLTAADILSRTHGSAMWASYYGVFVLAASIHASIGVRNILIEWSPLDDRRAGFFAVAFGLLLALLGCHAIIALVVT